MERFDGLYHGSSVINQSLHDKKTKDEIPTPLLCAKSLLILMACVIFLVALDPTRVMAIHWICSWMCSIHSLTRRVHHW
jgi:hypothetical protein